MPEEEVSAPEGAPAEVATHTEGTPAPATETDPWDNQEVTSFDRAYVTKLREEAASKRTAIKPYEEAFGSYDPEEQEIWFQLAKTMQTDPESAAEAMEAIVNGIRGLNQSEIEKPTPETQAAPAKSEFLTQEDLDSALSAREQKLALDREILSLNAEVAGLGYKPGTPEYNDLMWRAANQTNHDVQAAHAARSTEFETAITAYLEGKAKDASGSPRVVSTTGAPTGDASPIKTFADARAATEARLAAAMQGE